MTRAIFFFWPLERLENESEYVEISVFEVKILGFLPLKTEISTYFDSFLKFDPFFRSKF